jgi:hypothetical protein
MTPAYVILGMLWFFGALAVVVEAPSCPGFHGTASRIQSAAGWPILAAMNSASEMAGSPRKQLSCVNGQLGMRPVISARGSRGEPR